MLMLQLKEASPLGHACFLGELLIMLDWKDMRNLQQAVSVVLPRDAFVPQRELYQRLVCPIIT